MHVSTDMSAGLFVDTPLCARARSWCEAREDENVSLLFCSSHDGAGVRDLLLHVASEARRIKDARRERDAMSQKEDKELRTVWVADENVLACAACAKQFGWFLRKHHCRRCGGVKNKNLFLGKPHDPAICRYFAMPAHRRKLVCPSMAMLKRSFINICCFVVGVYLLLYL